MKTRGTKDQRSSLANFTNEGGALTPSAQAVVNEVRHHDEICNLAVSVAYRCEQPLFLRRILNDPDARKIFIKHLSFCVGCE